MEDSRGRVEAHGPPSTTPTSADEGLATRMLQECTLLLDSAIAFGVCGQPYSRSQKQSVVRIRQLLCIWGTDHGISDGALDRKLQRSKYLMRTVISVLRELLESTLELKPFDWVTYRQSTEGLLEQSSFVNDDESDSGSESDDEAEDEVGYDIMRHSLSRNEVLCNLQKGVRRLNDLNAPLDAFALDFELDQPEAPLPKISDPAPHESLANCIRERFPNARANLINHLGKISLYRYQRLQRLRLENVEAVAINVTNGASQPSLSEFRDSGYGSRPAVSSYQQSRASKAHYASSVTASVISSRISSLVEAGRSKFPKLPDEAKDGTLFECDACGRYIKAVRKQEYRKHLIRDLSPYVCIFENCTAASEGFPDRPAWIGHLRLEHRDADFWRSFQCPLCKSEKANESHALTIDIARHLEEISLLALPAEIDENDDNQESQSDDEDASKPDFRSDDKNEGTQKKQKESSHIADIKNAHAQDSAQRTELNPTFGPHISQDYAAEQLQPQGASEQYFLYRPGELYNVDSIPPYEPLEQDQQNNDSAIPVLSTGFGVAQQPYHESGPLHSHELFFESLSENLTSSLFRGSRSPSGIEPPLTFNPQKPIYPPKPTYQRPTREKLLCPHCNNQPNGFRGQHELQRHIIRAHSTVRKVWICDDVSGNSPDFLAKCNHCRAGKKYSAYYNAAAHLRRAHFDSRKRGSRNKGDQVKRGGAGCGDAPSIEFLKTNWMREIEERIEPPASAEAQDKFRDEIGQSTRYDHGGDSGSIPRDCWVCCSCHSGNLILLTSPVCPVCSHHRDGYC